MAVAITTNKNKKNTGTYAQWVTDTDTNAKIENTDQTATGVERYLLSAIGSPVVGNKTNGSFNLNPVVTGTGSQTATGAQPNAAVGSAVQGAASGAGVDVKYGVASPGKVDATGAPIGSPTTPYTETEDFAKWVADNGFTHENGKINTNPTVTTRPSTENASGGFSGWAVLNPDYKEAPKLPESPYRENMASLGVPTSSTGAFSKWSPTNQSQPTNVSTPPATGEQKEEVNEDTKTETETKAPVTDESGFSKWLATDPEMQARMRAAETDYYKNLATYGAQGEALVQSGLVGSGWSEYLKGNAYSAMQAEKAGVRSEGYAKWLADNETTSGTDGTISEAGSSLFKSLIEEGITEFTDAEKAKYLALGWSQQAIDEADAAMKNYTSTAKDEMVKNVSEIFDKFIADEDYDAFLSAYGADLPNMTEEEKATYFVSVVEDAVKEGVVTPEKASAAITKALIVEDDTTFVTIKDRVENAVGSVAIDDKIRGMISEEDYSRLVKSAYDSLGITKMYIDDKFGDLKAASTINIEVKNTKGKTETFKATALGVNSAKGLADTLTGQFGNASLAFYGDSCYYQYEKGKWAKITIDSTSYGDSALRSNLLRVVATYVGQNGVSIPRS